MFDATMPTEARIAALEFTILALVMKLESARTLEVGEVRRSLESAAAEIRSDPTRRALSEAIEQMASVL